MSRRSDTEGAPREPRGSGAPGPYNATVALRRTRLRNALAWTGGLIVVGGIVAAGLLSARPAVSEASSLAPDFTLPDTDGNLITLSSLRGHPVLLYFSEGAGCEACIYQMKAIEGDAKFADKGIVVLPIVMDPLVQIRAAMTYDGVTTPFLMDDGKVSAAYGTLGTGMHAGLPGHGFVLVNAAGDRVWSGDYPSMWIPPTDLLTEIQPKI
jgi:peroxiredoxin